MGYSSPWADILFCFRDTNPLPFPGPLSPGHLVADPALLYHIEPLRQSCVELTALVLHCVHHHRALGTPVQQQVCRPQAVLEAPVLPDVHVVLKSPAICKRKLRLQPHGCDTQGLWSQSHPLLAQQISQVLLSELKCKALPGMLTDRPRVFSETRLGKVFLDC